MSTDTIPSEPAATIRRELNSDADGTCRICRADSTMLCDDVVHRQARQPMPTKNNAPAIVDLVIADFRGRDEVGQRTYGTRLQAHNGRDPLRDAYEEALDMALYLRQCMEERNSDVKAAILAERHRIAARLRALLGTVGGVGEAAIRAVVEAVEGT